MPATATTRHAVARSTGSTTLAQKQEEEVLARVQRDWKRPPLDVDPATCGGEMSDSLTIDQRVYEYDTEGAEAAQQLLQEQWVFRVPSIAGAKCASSAPQSQVEDVRGITEADFELGIDLCS